MSELSAGQLESKADEGSLVRQLVKCLNSCRRSSRADVLLAHIPGTEDDIDTLSRPLQPVTCEATGPQGGSIRMVLDIKSFQALLINGSSLLLCFTFVENRESPGTSWFNKGC